MGDWGQGTGGGGGSTKAPVRTANQPLDPNDRVFRLATRLLNPKKAPPKKLAKEVMRVLRPYTATQIRDAAQKAGLSIGQVQQLQTLSGQNGDVSLGGTLLEAAQPALTALELTSRPLQAVKGAAAEGPRGAWRGLSGQEQYPFIQTVLRASGKSKAEAAEAEADLPGVVRFTGNFAGDVLADPTTYLSFGSSPLARSAARTAAERIAGEGAETAVKAAVYQRLVTGGLRALTRDERAVATGISGHVTRKLRGVQGGVKIAGRTIPGTGGALASLGPKGVGGLSAAERFFVSRAGTRQLERSSQAVVGERENVGNIMAGLRGGTHGGSMREQEAFLAGQVKKNPVLRLLGQGRTKDAFTDLQKRTIVDKLETDRVEDLIPRLRVAAEKLRKVQVEDEALLRANRGLTSSIEQQRYYPHYLSPEAQAAQKAGRLTPLAAAKIPGRAPGFLKPRSNLGLASEYGDRYVLDPFVAVGRHARETTQEVARLKAASELTNLRDTAGQPFIHLDPDVVKDLGRATDKWATVKWPVREVDETTGAIHTVNRDVLVAKAIQPDVANVMRFLQSTDDARSVLNAVSKINSVWSRMAISTPGFTIRNAVTNIWAGVVLAEARDMRDWVRSSNLMQKMLRGEQASGNPLQYIRLRDQRYITDAIRDNAVGSGFVSTLKEMAQAGGAEGLLSKARPGLKAVGGAVMGPINTVTAVNRFVEEWGHLAVYLAKRRQGFTSAEAASTVRKYLFDYQDLSTFDQAARYANPFLTWTRKNTPLMISTAIKNPGKISHVNTLLANARREGEQPEGLVPQWVRQSEGVTLPAGLRKLLAKAPVVGAAAQGGPLAIMPELPPVAAQQTLLPVFLAAKQLVGQGQPGGWKDVARTSINSLGLGGAPGGLLQYFAETASGTEFFSGRQVPRGTRVDTPPYLSWIPGMGKTVPYEAESFIQTFMPLANRVTTVAPTSDYDKAAQGRRWLSLLTGLRGFKLDDAAAKSEALRIYDLLEAIRRGAEARGIELPETYKGAGSSSSTGGNWG